MQKHVALITVALVLLVALISYSSSFACSSYPVGACPGRCSVCPPCVECSMLSCQSQEFCEGLGFTRVWYEGLQQHMR